MSERKEEEAGSLDPDGALSTFTQPAPAGAACLLLSDSLVLPCSTLVCLLIFGKAIKLYSSFPPPCPGCSAVLRGCVSEGGSAQQSAPSGSWLRPRSFSYLLACS